MLKIGPIWNYFSTSMDCGFISEKSEGSLAKRPGRTGIYSYGPSNLDLTIRTRPVLDLILRVRDGSGGHGFTWAPAAEGLAGTEVSAAALHWSRPNSAFPGSN